MKRIKQVNESKEIIYKALMDLLLEKNLEDITMTEIAKKAQVVRMTLYRHFKEKEDIILFGFDRNLSKVLDAMKKKQNPTLMDLLVLRFKILQESPYTNILAKNHKLDKLFQTIGARNIHHFSDILPKVSTPYENAFIAGGIDTLTKLWIENGMKESYKDMATEVLDIIYRLKVL